MHLYFPLLSLLDTPRHYVLSSLGCLYFLIFLCTWSLGGEWPLSPLDNSLLFKTELVPIKDCRVYFPRHSYQLIVIHKLKRDIIFAYNTPLYKLSHFFCNDSQQLFCFDSLGKVVNSYLKVFKLFCAKWKGLMIFISHL